jgi:PAS domain S-box-containing protein
LTHDSFAFSLPHLRQLADAMPQLVWTADPDGTVDYYNQRVHEFDGISQRTDGSWEWNLVVHPEDVAATQAAWEQALATGQIYEVSHRVRRKDGTFRWYYSRGVPARDEGGHIIKWYGTATDVHDLVEAEQKLRESEARFRALAENIPQLAWMANASGRITWFNQRWYDFTGADPDEVLRGNLGNSFVHPDHQERVFSSYHAAFSAGVPWQDTFPLRRHDGVYCWFFSQAAPIHDGDGKITRWVGTNTDVTQQRQAEADLQAYAAKLERSNRDLQEFAYVASHDLQEPLRKIQAFGGSLLNGQGNLSPQQRDYLERMRSAANRMSRMIEDLLTLSRVNTQARTPEMVDLDAVAAEVLQDLDYLVSRSSGQVTLAPLGTVRGDPGQLRQLLQNLIGNALKYHRPQTPPEVTVSAARAHGQLILTVRDNGIGFAPEHAERIFQPFQRLVGRHEFDGVGMGLAICRKIVERHGGEISAVGQPNAGATFTVTLPLSPPSA